MEPGRFVNKVEEELDAHTEPEHRRRFAEDDEPTKDPNELVAEQRRETGEMGGLPTTPLMSGSQGRGALGGAALGAAIGALVLAPFALIPFLDLEPLVRLVIVMIAGAAGGAVAAAVYFGGRTPELRGESVDADNTPSSGSSLADPGTDDRGRPE